MDQMTERDLLLALHTRFTYFEKQVTIDVSEIKARVTALERAADRQSGFFAGGKALWAFLASLPVGAVAFFMGKGSID